MTNPTIFYPPSFIESIIDMDSITHIMMSSQFRDMLLLDTPCLISTRFIILPDNMLLFMIRMTINTSLKKDTPKDICYQLSLSTPETHLSMRLIKHMTGILTVPESDLSCQILNVIIITIIGHLMYSASISKTLHLEVQKNFTSQPLNITAYSDFRKYNFTVNIVAKHDDDDDDDHHHDDHSKTD